MLARYSLVFALFLMFDSVLVVLLHSNSSGLLRNIMRVI